MDMTVKDKVAFVTGSARGIGREIAVELGKAGARVVISDVDANALGSAEKELRQTGLEVYPVVLDVSNADKVADAVAEIEKRFSRIDILVNNAGVTRDSLIIRQKEEDWDFVIRVNLKGTMNCTKQVARGMMKRQWGRIVNIASVVGQIGNVGQGIYSATKAGIIGFTKSMARELAPRNVTVNAVAPGFIQTEMTDSLPQDVKESFLSQIPLKRLGQTRDVANAVVFLSLEESSYITGEVLNVNGGMAMV